MHCSMLVAGFEVQTILAALNLLRNQEGEDAKLMSSVGSGSSSAAARRPKGVYAGGSLKVGILQLCSCSYRNRRLYFAHVQKT